MAAKVYSMVTYGFSGHQTKVLRKIGVLINKIEREQLLKA
jgi:hypothetical protein